MPPPELTSGAPHRPAGTCSHFQRALPLRASSAHSVPTAPSPATAVETYTSPSSYPGAMSITSPGRLASVTLQRSLPLLASSANARVRVAPYTVPSTTCTPFGPMSDSSYVVVHSVLPLSRSIADTFDCRSCT